MVDLVRKSMRIPIRRIQIIIQIMHVHCSITETPSWRNVEISNDFVDPESAFDPTALPTLSVQFFAVVFALALFDVFATAKSPGDRGVGFAHFFAGVAAAGLHSCGGRNGTIAVAAVLRVEVRGRFVAVTKKDC